MFYHSHTMYLVVDADDLKLVSVQVGTCASAQIQAELRTKNVSWPVSIYKLDSCKDDVKGRPWYVTLNGEEKKGHNIGVGELLLNTTDLGECWLPPVFDRYSETGIFAAPCADPKAYGVAEKAFMKSPVEGFDHTRSRCRADLSRSILWLPWEFYGIRITVRGSRKRFYSVVDGSCRPACLETENRTLKDAVRLARQLQRWLAETHSEVSQKKVKKAA
jgi:hypothetical protein